MRNKSKGKRILSPVPNGQITSPFGWRSSDNQFHMGEDLVNVTAPDVVAVFGGVIVEVTTGCIAGNTSCGGGYGNYITIDHENGYFTRYAHLQSILPAIQKGQRIKQGAKLGIIGNTGMSFGAHLHFELMTANTFYSLNPQAFLNPAPFISGEMLFPTPRKQNKWITPVLATLLIMGVSVLGWFLWVYAGFPAKKPLPATPPPNLDDAPDF